MRTAKWTEEAIIEELKNMAKADKDGIAYSFQAEAGMKSAVYHKFGDWQKACATAGVKSVLEFGNEEDFHQVCGRSDIIKTDLSKGIKVRYNDHSACFECKWATGKGDCSWVKDFTMPENAIYYEKRIKTDSNKWTWTPIIIYCPNFIKG